MNKAEHELLEVLQKAEIMDRFLHLTSPEMGYSLNQAAHRLGKSPSHFSGKDSMLARYIRMGLPGLLPQRRKRHNPIVRILAQLRKQNGKV